jgi:divalent metal cation (Fe/Co/Zn/Cd) transporter
MGGNASLLTGTGAINDDHTYGDARMGTLGGIGLGGILVIAGIVVALVWSVLLGIIIAVIGLHESPVGVGS